MKNIIFDSNVLIPLLDERDVLRHNAKALFFSIGKAGLEICILDCVLSESISVICRRHEEQKRKLIIKELIEKIGALVNPNRIFWSYESIRTLYPKILKIIEEHNGKLNFHDALIALFAQENDISMIASFDKDFDEITWIKRVFDESSLQSAFGSGQ